MVWHSLVFRWFSIVCAFLFTGALASEADDEAERRELHLYLKGRYLFQKQCTTCHGTTGRGNGPWAAELTDKPRNFRTGIFKFRTTPYGKLPVTDDLRRTIRSGISGTAMPFFKDFSDDDVDALIVFLQSLSREWDKEELQSEPLSLPEIPAWFGSVEKKQKHAASGAPLFKSTCAACHGEEGNGDGPGAKGLMDVWEHPITPAALSAEHHKSGDRPTDLYRTIATGLNGTPMIGYAEVLTEEQIWDLVAFIQSLPDPGKKDA
ncbi:MAG: cytochrome c [Verrucomicrobiales bacterium]|nr:cytochrome c [Verrucomicrobiales bacterium]